MSRFATAVAALAGGVLAAENVKDVFEQWMAQGKNYASEEQVERMAMFERNYHDVREDVQAAIDSEGTSRPLSRRLTNTTFGLDEYHEFDEIMAWLHDLGSSHPTLASVITLGDTYENRTVKGLRVGGGGDSQKPVIFVMGGIHGAKWNSPASCVYVIDSLVRKYGTDANITSIVDAFEWHIFPVTNADGYAYTWSEPDTDGRFWRKNRRPQAAGCTGADPNRNFDVRWCEDGPPGDKCLHHAFCGDHPFSEPEAENIRRYVVDLKENNRDIKGFVDIHVAQQIWTWPYSHSTETAPNEAALAHCGNAAVAALEGVNGHVYQTGSMAQMHKATGTATDWAYENGATYVYLVSLGDLLQVNQMDQDQNQIVQFGEELLNGLTGMATCMARDDGEATTMINGNERKMVLASFLVAAAMPLVQALQ